MGILHGDPASLVVEEKIAKNSVYFDFFFGPPYSRSRWTNPTWVKKRPQAAGPERLDYVLGLSA